jgi:hypothetical protein
LNRKLLVIAAVIVLFSATAAAVAIGYFAGTNKENFNVAEIYVLSWDMNTKSTTKAIDVQFRISVDSNGDGSYDFVRTSDLFRNTTVETVPFRMGYAIPTSVAEFQFKVEVFQVENGSQVPMNYLNSDTAPINSCLNEVGFSQSWKYDATTGMQKDNLACRISYVCYVDSSPS